MITEIQVLVPVTEIQVLAPIIQVSEVQILLGGSGGGTIAPIANRPTTLNEVINGGVELGLWP